MKSSKVAVPEYVLDDLRERLARTRLPDDIGGIGWEQGTERAFLAELLEYWRASYDWRVAEARLNTLNPIATVVDGQRIHLLHARSNRPDAMALLITHGWPGSVLEFLDVVGPLTEHFHVVVPSLPGFAFSGSTSQPGWHPRRIAAAFIDVMAELGYSSYGVQGGDWGSVVGANIADLRPDRVVGLHLNMVTAVTATPGAPRTQQEVTRYEMVKKWRKSGLGYQEIQGTKPQSLGYALEDSPAGLAGWIVEKFQEWSENNVSQAYSKDRLLDNITAYWVTKTATSSLRIYWEMRQAGPAALPQARIEVPTAVAMFPGEVSYPPRSWTEAAYNVVRWSEPARGGHFAAMEAPADYVSDVMAFFCNL